MSNGDIREIYGMLREIKADIASINATIAADKERLQKVEQKCDKAVVVTYRGSVVGDFRPAVDDNNGQVGFVDMATGEMFCSDTGYPFLEGTLRRLKIILQTPLRM